GDGYVACSIDNNGWDGSLSVVGGGDCDETSADADSTFPGAAELESTVDCMTDFDDDGYGDDNPSVSATAGTDCDDDDDTIYPGASEVQGDGIDQDCNGADEEIVVEWADVQSILSSCMGCHGNSGGLTITYDNIVNGSPSSTPAVDAQTGLGYIEPGDPDASYLWHKINGTQSSVGGSGGKMGNLSSSQLSTVEDWIIGGAQP
ncbi:MAG: MopE-related protein, partial [Myxococcota bacterium]|nr:MopE-related protein [Myxococcota bacterium]